MMIDADLTIPVFLVAPIGSRKTVVSRRRWKRILPQRPEGEKWATAERWEVGVPEEGFGNLASGTRCLWVLYQTGHKWAELRDAEGYAKVRAAEWERLSNKGRKL